MPTLINARRQFKSRLDTKQNVLHPTPALMGDGNGNVQVPGQPGYVYIRVGVGDLGQAFNNRCPLIDNLAIYVGYDPVTDYDCRIFQVLNVRMVDYAGSGNVPIPFVGPHHQTHEYGGGDDVYVSWRRIMGFRVGRPAGFVITIDGGNIIRTGAWLAVLSQTIDLTASKPVVSGQARYVLIVLDSTGTATATNGALVAVGMLDISDCPIPAAGEIPLAAVRLYGTQTAIGDTPTAPDIVDLRFPQAASAGAVYLADLDGYARGSIIRGGATDWESYALGGISGSVVTRNATDVIWSAGALSFAGAFTLTIPATGTAALGTGAATRIAYWSGANAITGDANLTYSGNVVTFGQGGVTDARVKFSTRGNAPDYPAFWIGTNYGTFGGVNDDYLTYGYNFNSNGSPNVAGYPVYARSIEARYNNGSIIVVEDLVSWTNSINTYTVRPQEFAIGPIDAANQASLDSMWWWRIGTIGNSKFLWGLATTGSLMELDPDGTFKFYDPTDVTASHYGRYTFAYTVGTDTSQMTYGIGGPAANNGIYIPGKVGIGIAPDYANANTILNINPNVQFATSSILLFGTYGRWSTITDTAALYHSVISHGTPSNVILQVGRNPNAVDGAIQLPRNSNDTELLRITASQAGGSIVGVNGYYIDSVAPSSSTGVINFRFINTGVGAFTHSRVSFGNTYSHMDTDAGTSVYIPHDYQNVGLCGAWWGETWPFGSGRGVLRLADAGTVPSHAPDNGVVLYSQSGVLKYYNSSGINVMLTSSGAQTITALSAVVDTSLLTLNAGQTGIAAGNDAGHAMALAFDGYGWSGGTGWAQRTGAKITMLKEESWDEGGPGGHLRGALQFFTVAGSMASPSLAEWMRITSAGYVGIGTTSPSSKLHVNGTITATNYGSVTATDYNIVCYEDEVVCYEDEVVTYV